MSHARALELAHTICVHESGFPTGSATIYCLALPCATDESKWRTKQMLFFMYMLCGIVVLASTALISGWFEELINDGDWFNRVFGTSMLSTVIVLAWPILFIGFALNKFLLWLMSLKGVLK